MNNYIKAIIIDTPKGDDNLNIEMASPVSGNSITLISGRNQTGKTHILEQVEHSIEAHNSLDPTRRSKFTVKRSNIQAELHDMDEPLNLLSILDIRNAKKYLEKIPFKIDNNKPSNLEVNIKALAYSFLAEEIEYIFDDYFQENFNSQKWNTDVNYKFKIMDLFFKRKFSVFPCALHNEMVDSFETMIDGQLHIGSDNVKGKQVKNLVFYIKYSDEHIFPFSDWSEGQKVLFILLLINYYGKYNVLLIDELENNLHPEFMSNILEKLKKNVEQVIITSHNPHLIFSKYIDKVLYIETNNNKMTERKQSRIILNNDGRIATKKQFLPFNRTIIDLNKDIEKMAKTYHLFDSMDKNLLNLSMQIYEEMNEHIIKILGDIFNYDAINEKDSKKVDIQSSKLGELLIGLRNKDLKILDYGSGKGRTYFEIKKENIPQKLGKHMYYFWESFPENREELKKKVSSSKIPLENIEIIDTVENVQKDYYDLIFLSNVLHECNPMDFAKILKHCQYALKENGELIIIELYPLLKPEKYAVSYSEDEMSIILDTTGWKITNTDKLNITSKSTSAYWLSAKKRSTVDYTIIDIKNAILKVWEIIEKKYARNYEGIEKLNTINNFNTTLSSLTILTSIISYNNERWECFLDNKYYNTLDR